MGNAGSVTFFKFQYGTLVLLATLHPNKSAEWYFKTSWIQEFARLRHVHHTEHILWLLSKWADKYGFNTGKNNLEKDTVRKHGNSQKHWNACEHVFTKNTQQQQKSCVSCACKLEKRTDGAKNTIQHKNIIIYCIIHKYSS